MYIKLINNLPEIYSITQLRRDNPQVSFPRKLSDEMLAQFGVYPLSTSARPQYNPQTHYLKESSPQQISGVWKVGYTVEPLSSSQVEATMREKRNALLAETDWRVSKAYEEKIEVPTELVKYRQKLRDITTQQGFPYEIIWPQKPSYN
jgi:hypothetical protein